MKTLFTRFVREEAGQDIIEYSLLAAFISISGYLILQSIGSSVNTIYTKVQTATIYSADSGATVFAAGTFQWSWALDTFGQRSFRGVTTPPDRRVERMTRNLFDRLGDGSV